MPQVSLAPIFNGWQGFTAGGLPLSGGKINTYLAGTTTPHATYTTIAGSVANANPIILQADGRPPFEIWLELGIAYKFVLTDSLGLNAITYDNIDGIGEAAQDISDALAAPSGSSLIGFQQAGAGTVVRTAESKLRERISAFDFMTTAQIADVQARTELLDVTVAVQAWIDACMAAQSDGWLPYGTYSCGALAKTFAGNRITQNLVLRGAGRNSSIIKQRGVPTQLILFAGSSPATGGNAAQIVLRDMGLQGDSKTCIGLTLDSVNDILLDNVRIEGFTDNLNLSSALLITANKCQFANGNIGIKTRRHGTSSYCNSLAFTDCTLAGNSANAGDFGAANNVIVTRAVVETCGTVGDTTTGPWIIRNTCDDETGYAQFVFEDCDYEQNQGRGLQVEAMSSGFDLEIRGGSFLTHATANDDIYIAGARRVRIAGFRSLSATSVWNITADQLHLDSTKVTTLTDAGVTYPTYTNAEANGTTYLNGLSSSFTGTLTQVTGTVTGTIKYIKQGDLVTLTLDANLVGASPNANAPTITGMPALLIPSASRTLLGICQDASTEKASSITVANTGVINLANGFSSVFTAAGNKGASAQILAPYKI